MRKFDSGTWDNGGALEATADGGYILAGKSGDGQVWLVKTDSLGRQLWESKPLAGQLSWSWDVHQTSDGGYIVVGGVYGSSSDLLLLKTTATGSLVWQRSYGGDGTDEGVSVQQTGDGGYIVAGRTTSYGSGMDDVWLIKTDPAGNSVWSRTFGDGYPDDGSWVQQAEDGGYVVAATKSSWGSTPDYSYFWLIKTDQAGYQQWERLYAGGMNVWCASARHTPDGGYILAGNNSLQSGSPAGAAYIILVKTDSLGNPAWENHYQESNNMACINCELASDGGYVLVGSMDYNPGNADLLVLKVDPLGIGQWMGVYGGDLPDMGIDIVQTHEGGFTISGTTNSYAVNGSDLWLIRLAAE